MDYNKVASEVIEAVGKDNLVAAAPACADSHVVH